MTTLFLVPNAYLRKWRQEATHSALAFVPQTFSGLVAQILKEGLVSYKEDEILEEIAVWQVVQEYRDHIKFFEPILPYPGFIAELKWLFRQIDYGEEIWQKLPELGKEELRMLHSAYHAALKEQDILDKPAQIKVASKLAEEKLLLPEISAIELRGLGELSPLEQQFLKSFAAGRPLHAVSLAVEANEVEVVKAADPYEEVEQIGLAIRKQVEQGVALDQIGLAFANLTSYQPILLATFGKLGIPWRSPAISLRNTPLGKAFLTLIAGELEGWHKHHLQLLTAPGWGFPFNLSASEHRALRLGPPLRGLVAWRSYLGQYPNWEQILDLLATLEQSLVTQSLCEYGDWLTGLLARLRPDLWVKPEEELDNWAELVKAWDGLEKIAQSLKQYEWVCTTKQFLQLMQALLTNYQVQARRVFQEQLQVISPEQFGAHVYTKIFVGGLVEGQFPPLQQSHWLTKTKTQIQTAEFTQSLLTLAQEIFLSYPETDFNGKLNLPSTFLPSWEKQDKVEKKRPAHRPSLYLGQGLVQDPVLLAEVQERILTEGLSTSQLNRYANCPYQFFCSYILELAPQEELALELDPRERGIMLHDSLYQFWSNHLQGALPSVEQAQAEFEGIVRAEYVQRGEVPPTKLIQTLRWFIREDLVRAASGFRPRFLEHWFQGLAFATSRGIVQVRGQIDRIDQNERGEYVLYDYKTGSAPSVQDILQGSDLQIAIYLLAARGLLENCRNVGVAYYSLKNAKLVGIFHLDLYKELRVHKGKGCLEEEQFSLLVEKFTDLIIDYLEQMFRGKFPIKPISNQICRYCPYQGLCRKEVGV